MEEQPVLVRQAIERQSQVDGPREVLLAERPLHGLREPEDRPPAPAPGHPALIGDDGEEPRPGGAELRADPGAVTPGLQRHLLDRVLRGLALVKHGQRKAVCRLDEGSQDLLKSLAVAVPGTVQDAYVSHAAHQMHQGRGKILFGLSAMVGGMADPIFEHPRLAAIYDALDPDRSYLDVYVAIAEELGARRALDVGCGTGTFALLLAGRGLEVTGLDPAGASLDVARAKPNSERVRWICGDAKALPAMQVDLATMTGNVAQAIVDPPDWDRTLRGVHDALRPGGSLVFETRDPARRAWEEWNRAASYKVTEIQGVGVVESWVEVIDVRGELVTFRWTWVFASDRQVLTSDSTLRFRERDEVEATLVAHGYAVKEVRDAPDRPRRELVFFAVRQE
jgi:SAM-dependent methyltransferase